LRERRTSSATDMLQYLRGRDPTVTLEQANAAIQALVRADAVAVEDIPPITHSIGEFLSVWEWNLGAYFAIGISITALIVIAVQPVILPLVILRWLIGSVFVLFIPGFVLTETLFPTGNELGGRERFALSVGLSLGVVALIGLGLTFSPWGVRLVPLLVCLSALSLGLSVASIGRRFRISKAHRRSTSRR